MLLDITPDQSMVDEGVAREVINRIQKLRKKVRKQRNDTTTHPRFISVQPLERHHINFINLGNICLNVLKGISHRYTHLYSSGIPQSLHPGFVCLLFPLGLWFICLSQAQSSAIRGENTFSTPELHVHGAGQA